MDNANKSSNSQYMKKSTENSAAAAAAAAATTPKKRFLFAPRTHDSFLYICQNVCHTSF